MDDKELEVEVVRRFLKKSRRDRYVAFLQSDKTRPKFIRDLSRYDFLQHDLFNRIEGNERVEEVLAQRLQALYKVQDCYVIADDKSIDRQRLVIAEALKKVVGADRGALLIFGNAEVVYSEAEGLNNRWLSKPLAHTRIGG